MNPKLIASLLMWIVSIDVWADEIPWLDEVQRPPTSAVATPRVLSPLLDVQIESVEEKREQWQVQRLILTQAWQELLGPSPSRPESTQFEELHSEQLEGVIRKVVRYENEPGQFLDAYLLQPTESTKRGPGIIALHATTDKTNQPIAGVAGQEHEQIGLKLAKQGFVVLCPKNFLWQDGSNFDQAVANFKQRNPNSLGMRKMLYDAMRATDILAALPNVDDRRIGAIGHSLGAKEVLYLAALDNRIAAAVFSEGGLEFESTNWHAPWYLGPVVNDPGFPRNHHELIALIAPRPLLVLGGQSQGAADGDRSWPYLSAAIPIYQLYDRPVRLGLFNHNQGHSLPPNAFSKASEWLTTYLTLDSSGR